VTYMVARFLEDYAKCVSEKTETVNLEYEDDLEAILILFDQGFPYKMQFVFVL